MKRYLCDMFFSLIIVSCILCTNREREGGREKEYQDIYMHSNKNEKKKRKKKSKTNKHQIKQSKDFLN